MPLRTDLKVGDPHTAAHNEERAFANGLETRAKNIEDAASALNGRVSANETLTGKHASRHAFGGSDVLTADDIRAMPVRGTLTAAQPLDDLILTGIYWQGNSSGTTTDVGYPTNSFAGLIEVFTVGTLTTQRTTFFNEASNTRNCWVRTKYSTNPWSAWRPLSSGDVITVPATQNLDELRTPGSYYVASGATPGLPFAVAGILDVVGRYVNDMTMQRFVTRTGLTSSPSNGRFYHRLWTGSGWTEWIEYSKVGHTHTPAEVSAVPLASDSRTGAGEDANLMTTPGKFLVATSCLNTPGAFVGHIEVIDRSSGDQLVQRFTASSGVTAGEQWIRYRGASSSSWQPWKKFLISADLEDRGLYGTGSPLGIVVPKAKGVVYTDRDATNGVRQWISFGTSSSNWQVLSGDTGWRVISSWTAGGVVTGAALPAYFLMNPGETGLIRFRRENQEVTLDIRGCTWDRPAQVPIPTGFTPAAGESVATLAMSSTSPVSMYIGASTVYLQSMASPLPSGYGFQPRWRSSSLWPTSLPGAPG